MSAGMKRRLRQPPKRAEIKLRHPVVDLSLAGPIRKGLGGEISPYAVGVQVGAVSRAQMRREVCKRTALDASSTSAIGEVIGVSRGDAVGGVGNVSGDVFTVAAEAGLVVEER